MVTLHSSSINIKSLSINVLTFQREHDDMALMGERYLECLNDWTDALVYTLSDYH